MSGGRAENGTDVEARALRLLVDELRAAPPPALDWSRVEARLLERLARERALRPRRRRDRTWHALTGFAAAAAAITLLILGQGKDAGPQHLTVPLPVSYAVADMPPGSIVESADHSLRFALPGVATWVLEPHSRAVVEAVTRPLVVRLLHGRMHAEVVAHDSSDELVEAFVVEAGGARVAVHGTVFSVERSGEQLTVEVTRGTVTVGPAGHRGLTTAHLLVSPARATFSWRDGRLLGISPPSDASALRVDGPAAPSGAAASGRAPDGSSAARGMPPAALAPRASTDPAALGEPGGRGERADQRTPKRPAQGEPGAALPTPASPTASAETADEAGSGLATQEAPPLSAAAARALVVGCLEASAPEAGSENTRVTLSSRVTALVGSDGRVETIRFAPPLRPELQQRCGSLLFGRRTTSGGALSFTATVAAK